jgi:hypothetical protein
VHRLQLVGGDVEPSFAGMLPRVGQLGRMLQLHQAGLVSLEVVAGLSCVDAIIAPSYWWRCAYTSKAVHQLQLHLTGPLQLVGGDVEPSFAGMLPRVGQLGRINASAAAAKHAVVCCLLCDTGIAQ